MGVEIITLLLTKALEFSIVMQKASAEGRDVSAEELQVFRDSLMASDSELEAAIDKAKSEGR